MAQSEGVNPAPALGSSAPSLAGTGLRDLYDRFGAVLAGVVLFLAPVLTPVVDHGGSTLFVTLAIYSLGVLVSVRSRWRGLERTERVVLTGLLLLFFTPLLSLVNAGDLESFLKTYERFARLLLIVPVYLLLRGSGLNLWPYLLAGCVLAGPVLAGVAWHDTVVMKYPRALGAYHPIVFGDIAALVALFMLIWLATHRLRVWYALIVLSTAAALYAAVLAEARGAWITLVLCLPLVLLAAKRVMDRRLMGVVVTGIVALLIVAWFAWPTLKGKFDETLANYEAWTQGGGSDRSLGNRMAVWALAAEIWREHPLVGTGAGDFKSHVIDARDTGAATLIEDFDHAHSIYLHYLATTGTIGFAVMLFGLIVIPAFYFVRHTRPPQGAGASQAWAGIVLVAAFALFGLTETWTARSPLMSLFAILLPALMVSCQVPRRTDRS